MTGGGYRSEGGARVDARTIGDAGFANAVVLLRNDDYRTVLLGFVSDDAARATLSDVRDTIRSSAYLRDFSVWCPEYVVEADGVVICSAE